MKENTAIGFFLKGISHFSQHYLLQKGKSEPSLPHSPNIMLFSCSNKSPLDRDWGGEGRGCRLFCYPIRGPSTTV